MPDIKHYDYQRPPEKPAGVQTTQYFFAPEKMTTSLPCRAPWVDGPCMALHYDKDGKLLLLTRFIFMDGTYKDANGGLE